MWTPDTSIIKTAEQSQEENRQQTIEQFRNAIQTRVNEVAKSRLYEDGNSLASYVASTNEVWAAEAQAFVAWRDYVWAYSYSELEKVLNGSREKPSVEEFFSEIDSIEWP